MALYDSNNDVFFIRIWRTASRSIIKKMQTDSSDASLLYHNETIFKGNTAAFTETTHHTAVSNLHMYVSVDDLKDTTYENSWKFAVIRNPYAHVYSDWKQFKKKYDTAVNMYGEAVAVGGHHKPRFAANNTVCTDAQVTEVATNFNRYVEAMYSSKGWGLDTSSSVRAAVYRWGYGGQLYHANGVLGVDAVLYQEDLSNEWNTKVASVKGYSNNINIVVGNIGSDDYQSAYNNTSIALVANAYSADLDLFGYTFKSGNSKPTHTIPTQVDTGPNGPWKGLAKPGRYFYSNGGKDNGKMGKLFIQNDQLETLRVLSANT